MKPAKPNGELSEERNPSRKPLQAQNNSELNPNEGTTKSCYQASNRQENPCKVPVGQTQVIKKPISKPLSSFTTKEQDGRPSTSDGKKHSSHNLVSGKSFVGTKKPAMVSSSGRDFYQQREAAYDYETSASDSNVSTALRGVTASPASVVKPDRDAPASTYRAQPTTALHTRTGPATVLPYRALQGDSPPPSARAALREARQGGMQAYPSVSRPAAASPLPPPTVTFPSRSAPPAAPPCRPQPAVPPATEGATAHPGRPVPSPVPASSPPQEVLQTCPLCQTQFSAR